MILYQVECAPGDRGPVPGLDNVGEGGADGLPGWEEAHTTVIPMVRHIPKAAREDWARVLTATVSDVCAQPAAEHVGRTGLVQGLAEGGQQAGTDTWLREREEGRRKVNRIHNIILCCFQLLSAVCYYSLQLCSVWSVIITTMWESKHY